MTKERLSDGLLLQIKSNNDRGLYFEQYDPSPVIDRMYHDIISLQQEAEKWRTEAFRKYPTPDAYEAACAALEKHRQRADAAEQQANQLERDIECWKDVVDQYKQQVNMLKKIVLSSDDLALIVRMELALQESPREVRT